MNERKPNFSSSEQAEINKERILLNAEMLKKGAKVTPDNITIPSGKQRDEAKIEMGDAIYEKNKEANNKIGDLKELIGELIAGLKERHSKLSQKLLELNNGNNEIKTIKRDQFSKEYDPTDGSIDDLDTAEDLNDIISIDIKQGATEKEIVNAYTKIINRLERIIDSVAEGKELLLVEYENKNGNIYVPWLVKKETSVIPEENDDGKKM